MIRITSVPITMTSGAMLLGCCLFGQFSWANDDDDNKQAMQASPRFVDKLLASRPSGATVPVNVDIRIWTISEHQPVRLPVSGFYVANLISGTLVTVMNETTETHPAGDFWTVPNGVPMFVAVKGQAAILQTIAANVVQIR
jgi:hypothetical protein